MMIEGVWISGVVVLGIVFLSWLLMRTLWLPRVGCWLFYLSTLAGLFLILVSGLAFVGIAALIQHFAKDGAQKSLVLSGTAVLLMFLGKWFLKARNRRPFQAVMRWFLRHSFQKRVGATLPPYAVNDPRRLAFRAVLDESYGGDPNYGSVEGWGVKACCKRLMRIKHNR
ncbi:MAG: hypothetical protein P4M04_13895 [Acidobacteriota bacterium]|nr:hypothetical protein [Acidobacteriota bacterium]